MEYKHKNKSLLSRVSRVNSTDYVRTFLLELAVLEKKPYIQLNSPAVAERIKGLLNIPKNTTFKSLSDIETGLPYWDEQLVDYIDSNLGQGYIFYFICNRCGRKVKYLYEYDMTRSRLCRICCRFEYRRSKHTARKLTYLS